MQQPNLPQIGDTVPSFVTQTKNGTLRFPEDFKGHWTIFFAHPGNFTAAWVMYSSILIRQERKFTEQGVKLLALFNEQTHKHDFSENVNRYLDIYLKSPVVEDVDFAISNQFGMASRRHREQSHGRLVYILDPEGIVRHITENPQPSIETIIRKIVKGLRDAQGRSEETQRPPKFNLNPVEERLDVSPGKPAYFNKEKGTHN